MNRRGRESRPPQRFSPGRADAKTEERQRVPKRERSPARPPPSEHSVVSLTEAAAPLLALLTTISEEQQRQTRYLARVFKIIADVEDVLVDIHEATAQAYAPPIAKVAKPSPPDPEPGEVIVSLQASAEEVEVPAAAAVGEPQTEIPAASALLEARLNTMTNQ